MTTLTGIRDATYLAQFLGKKIAIRDSHNRNAYAMFPRLFSICDNGTAQVRDSKGRLFLYKWDRLENPYIILQSNVKIEMR